MCCFCSPCAWCHNTVWNVMTSCQAFVGYWSALIDSRLHLCTLGQLRDGKIKSSPYSITERRVPQLVSVLGSQPAGDWVINPAVACHNFPPGLQLPPQPLRACCYQFCCLVNRGTMGVSSLPKTVTGAWLHSFAYSLHNRLYTVRQKTGTNFLLYASF